MKLTTLPSNQRSLSSGVSLLETLLALGVLSLVLSAGYSLMSSIFLNHAKASHQLSQSELAYAVLTEFSVTYPQMASSGKLGEQYTWSVTTTPYEMSRSDEIRLNARWLKFVVSVRETGTESVPFTAQTILAVGAQE